MGRGEESYPYVTPGRFWHSHTVGRLGLPPTLTCDVANFGFRDNRLRLIWRICRFGKWLVMRHLGSSMALSHRPLCLLVNGPMGGRLGGAWPLR